MLSYFKVYLDHIVEPTVIGASLGTVCGGVAGIVGLYQMCSGNDGTMALDLCSSIEPQIIPSSQKAAAIAGAVAGSLIGLTAGAVVYPICTGFVFWCKRDIERRSNRQSELGQEGVGLDIRL